MDAMDEKILGELKLNARITAASMSKKVNLSVPAVLERMKKLSHAGVIQGYTVRVNRARIGLTVLAFVFVRLSASRHIPAFREAVIQMDHVMECHHVAGDYDYLLKVVAEDTESLEQFLTDQLKKMDGVLETKTLITLATLKENPYA